MTHFRHHTTTGSPITTQMNHSSLMNTGQKQRKESKRKEGGAPRYLAFWTTMTCLNQSRDLLGMQQRTNKQKTVREFKKNRKEKRKYKHTEEGNCQLEHSRVCTWKTTPNRVILASARGLSCQVMQLNLINTPEIRPLGDSRYIIIYPTPEKAILILLFVDSIRIKHRH